MKQVKVDELDVIDDNYLRGIESLYTWKILVPERLRSGSYSYTLLYVNLISGGWEDDRVNDGAKQVKQVIR